MKINEFQQNQRIETMLLVSQVSNGMAQNGAPYLTVSFKDNSGVIDGKVWDVKPEQIELLKAGNVVKVLAEVIDYRGKLQLKVLSAEKIDQNSIDISEFLPTTKVPINELRETIDEAIERIGDSDIKAVVSEIYKKYDTEIYSSPAAAKNHHEFKGGLATHVVGMLRLAQEVCKLYPVLNEDLLVAGVLLHDVGKIKELGGIAVTEYTLEGKLLGHISISQTMVQETADELGIESESITLLRHLILSHHGEYEFGSPVLPLTIEAEVLHYIDDFDAKITMIKKELDQTKEGEFTTRIPALNGRAFYKMKQ